MTNFAESADASAGRNAPLAPAIHHLDRPARRASRSALGSPGTRCRRKGRRSRSRSTSGEGLQAGQSQLKYKDIVFGTVKSLALSPDQTHVVVTVATTRRGRPAADRGNRVLGRQAAALRRQYFRHRDPAFGVVYRHVAGREGRQEPAGICRTRGSAVLGAHVPGRTFFLKSKRIGAVSVGSPIFFRDLASARCSAGTSPIWRNT